MSLSRNRAKQIIAPVVLALATLAVMGIIAVAAVAQRSSTQGADPADALVEVPDGLPALGDFVEWLPDAPLQEREVEPATRRAVEATWTRAWGALKAAAAGDGSRLDTWFAGPALQQVSATSSDDGEDVDIDLGPHRLRIVFYSDDGAVLGLRAESARVRRTIDSPLGPVTRTTDEDYEVVLLLEDGNWRIRQWLRTSTVAILDE